MGSAGLSIKPKVGIIRLMMNRIFRTLLICVAATTLFVSFSSFANAQDVYTGEITEAEEPQIYSEGESTVYSQRVLVKITAGTLRNVEEATTHTFPTPGMKRKLEVGDKVVVEVNEEDLSEPFTIVDFERKSYLAILPIVVIVTAMLIYARGKGGWAYVVGVVAYPILTFLAVKYGKIPPIVAAGVLAAVIGTATLAVQYSKLVPIVTSIAAFALSYLLGGGLIYGLTQTLNIFTGITEPFTAFYNVEYSSTQPAANVASLLIIPFAAILSIIAATLTEVIQARAQQQVNSKAELVRAGVAAGLAASKDSVFSFLMVALGFIFPITLALSDRVALGTIINLEVFNYLMMLAITPILMSIVSVLASGIVSGLMLGTATPHKLVSDKEAPQMFATKKEEPEGAAPEPEHKPELKPKTKVEPKKTESKQKLPKIIKADSERII